MIIDDRRRVRNDRMSMRARLNIAPRGWWVPPRERTMAAGTYAASWANSNSRAYEAAITALKESAAAVPLARFIHHYKPRGIM
jgi:hypothetical protein